MAGLGRMNEKGGGAGAGQGRSDLASDMTGLAHAADDHAPMAIENQQQCLHEVAIDAVDQRQYGVGFYVQNLAGQVERFRRGLYWAHEVVVVIMGRV
ncbi:MAG: hypothetical protein AW09_003745 [Candidatus Accumulibacter phosphatis]|uniref:Uncharacterized protein n=1 Tax=Candidatus Accumulibacter phosphatis TaxID=327160 RepID=A0A080LS60_9PROT|nr:MAG: hypothetical protein AW09_003745 [Candidatus Accumulibacter phosphatis]